MKITFFIAQVKFLDQFSFNTTHNQPAKITKKKKRERELLPLKNSDHISPLKKCTIILDHAEFF
jgi:hypothetical protein